MNRLARRLLVLVGIALLSVSTAAAKTKYPYLSYVRQDDSIVRSGPGDQYYGTDKISRGTHVEVYKQIGRWCAIRPPKNSFSWIPASGARLTSESTIAVITSDNVKSSIGTNLRFRGRRKFQIVLRRGERVEVLGARRVQSRGKTVVWYKIAPPSGEFRWVANDQLIPVPVQTKRSNLAARSSPRIQPVSGQSKPTIVLRGPSSATNLPEPRRLAPIADARPLPSVFDQEASRRNPTRLVQHQANTTRTPTIASNGWKQRGSQSEQVSSKVLRTVLAKPSPSASVIRIRSDSGQPNESQRAARSGQPIIENLSGDSIRRVELDLSSMVTRPHKDWNIGSLQQRVRRLAGKQTDTFGRARRRLLLEKLGKFAEIQRSSLPKVATRSKATIEVREIRPGPSSPKSKSSRPKSNVRIPSGFDGYGYLWPVDSRDASDPPYALVSEDNQLLQFVSPAPGVSLHAFLQKKVSIQGQRGYSRKWKKPHLTAQRIVERK